MINNYDISLIVRKTKINCKDAYYGKIKSHGKVSTSFDRFVDKLEDQDCQSRHYRTIISFLCRFYIKYQNDIDNIELANRDVVLTFMLTYYALLIMLKTE
jgi:hypothetical protein